MARKFPTLWQGSPEACIMLFSPAPLLGDLLSENIGKREVQAAEDLLDFSQCRRLLAVCKTVKGRFGDPELAGKAGITLLAAQSFQEVRKRLVQTGHFPSLAGFSFRMWMIFHIRSIRQSINCIGNDEKHRLCRGVYLMEVDSQECRIPASHARGFAKEDGKVPLRSFGGRRSRTRFAGSGVHLRIQWSRGRTRGKFPLGVPPLSAQADSMPDRRKEDYGYRPDCYS